MKGTAAGLLWVLGLGAGAGAQEQPAAQAPSEQPASEQVTSEQTPAPEETSLARPTRDLFDVVRDWRHKPPPPPPGPDDYKKWMVAAAPVVSYSPTTGFGIGAAGTMAVYQGLPDTTRISSIVASVTATTKSQVLVNAKINATSRNNRRPVQSDTRLYWTSQKPYGRGTDSREDAAVDQKYDYFRFFETMFWRVVPNTYLGAGFLYSNHRNVRPADAEAEAAWATSPYVTYSEQNGFDLESQTSAGLGLDVLFDSRDGAINPSRGWYARLSYGLLFKGFLGGASDWQIVNYDGRWREGCGPDSGRLLESREE